MEDVMFVVKCFIVTAVIIVAMQIRVGHQTAESHVMSWLHNSTVSHTLQDVAEGAVKAGKSGKDAVMNLVGSNESADEPAPTEASTGGWFKIKRSAAYHRQKARAKAEEQARLNEGAEVDPDANVERE
jgi:hypothetical protein